MEYYNTVIYILSGMLGLCVGSFLNVVIYRVPAGMSIALPPSHCPNCNYRLKWYDNIPVLSYIILGGKCRSCKEHISFRYTAVELLNTVLWLLSVWFAGTESLPLAIGYAVVCSLLVCVFYIDLEHKLIFNRFVIALAATAIYIGFFDKDPNFIQRFIAMGIFGGGFLLFWFIVYKIYGREAFGAGDVKLMAALALLLGITQSLLTMLIASLTASVTLLVLRAKRGDDKQTEYPFAPFLVLGALISMFAGDFIVNSYMQLFGL